jgi:hypothetical protein
MLFHGGIDPIAAYVPTGGVDAVGTPSGYGSYALVLLAVVVVLLGIYDPGQLADRPRVTLFDPPTTDSEGFVRYASPFLPGRREPPKLL